MSRPICLLAGVAIAALAASPSFAQRYAERRPLAVPPSVSAPWVMQLQRRPLPGQGRGQTERLPSGYAMRPALPRAVPPPAVTPRPVFAPTPAPLPQGTIDPVYLPQIVDYPGREKAGTIDIDTRNRFLYHVLPGGKAKRYGVGVGKEGFGWTGSETITQKKEWPSWRPPAEMIARERKKGRELPTFMPGGEANPLGARALYLGSTLYRIHGTNAPWTIGQNVSSGCFRMRNEDVMALYGEVGVGTRVVVR